MRELSGITWYYVHVINRLIFPFDFNSMQIFATVSICSTKIMIWLYNRNRYKWLSILTSIGSFIWKAIQFFKFSQIKISTRLEKTTLIKKVCDKYHPVVRVSEKHTCLKPIGVGLCDRSTPKL